MALVQKALFYPPEGVLAGRSSAESQELVSASWASSMYPHLIG